MRDIVISNDESGIVQRRTAMSAVNEILGRHEAGFEIINETRPDAIERFVVVHLRGIQRLLVPPAQKIGLKSDDLKFEPALNTSLKNCMIIYLSV